MQSDNTVRSEAKAVRSNQKKATKRRHNKGAESKEDRSVQTKKSGGRAHERIQESQEPENSLTLNRAKITTNRVKSTVFVEEIRIMAKDISTLKQSNDRLSADVSKVKDEKRKMAEDISTLKQSNNRFTADIKELKSKNKKMDEKISNLKNSNARLTARITALEERDKDGAELASVSYHGRIPSPGSAGNSILDINWRDAAKTLDKENILTKKTLEESGRSSSSNTLMRKEQNVVAPAQKRQRKTIRRPSKYIPIVLNNIVGPVKFSIQTEEDICSCEPIESSDLSQCGPGSKCINYNTSIECNANCPAKGHCQNQQFTKRIYSKVGLEYFESKGWGLVARENIPRNTFIIEYLGDVIDKQEFERRHEKMTEGGVNTNYFMSLGNGLFIDAAVRGNEGRFINHSCEPNSEMRKWQVGNQNRIGIFAIVDISIVRTLLHYMVCFTQITAWLILHHTEYRDNDELQLG